MNSDFATLYIVRHGETEWNREMRLQGQADSPLTAEALVQAAEVGKELAEIPFAAAFSSDILRAKRTAEIIALERDLAVNTSELIRERSFGSAEGKHYTAWQEENKEMLDRLEALGEADERWHFRVKDEETDHEITERTLRFLREVAVSYPGKNILIVSHGALMRVLLIRLGWAKYKEKPRIANLAWIKLESDGVEFNVRETKRVVRSMPEVTAS